MIKSIRKLIATSACALICAAGTAHADDHIAHFGAVGPINNVTFQTNQDFYDFYTNPTARRVITPWPGNEVRCAVYYAKAYDCEQIDNEGTWHKLTGIASGRNGQIFEVADHPLPGLPTNNERDLRSAIADMTALALGLPTGSADSNTIYNNTIYSNSRELSSALSGDQAPIRHWAAFEAFARTIYQLIPVQRMLISGYLNRAMGT